MRSERIQQWSGEARW